MHRHDVAELLQRNIESEQVALGKFMALQAELPAGAWHRRGS